MSNGKVKTTKSSKAAPVPAAPAPKPVPVRVPPLFRKIDWLTLGITFAVVLTTYFLTLAPELTLEDSGELCTGAFYAGIPHPPGYPFWAIYSWCWTALLPFGNIALRVEIGEATAAAMGCALLAFMVSRGSSMFVEGIEELKNLSGKWENAICLISGVVAGLLLGFDGVMWHESVAINRISLFGVPWVMVVLLCLMRWIYAPHQRRYLYCAMFFFGICATIHQTLLVAAMAIEATVVAVQPRLGRDLLLGNSILFVLGLIAQHAQLVPFLDTPTVFNIYCAVGIGSTAAWIWLATKTRGLGTEWKVVLFVGLLWFLGASFYFYEAIAGMSNPPMQWGYPRTVEGFFHALSRGQYEKPNPTDILHDPARFVMQLGMLVGGVADEFNWVLLFVALLPFLFFLKMQKRERAWLTALGTTYFCIGVLLVILMNPSPDRQSADLIKVFFTASHGILAILMGYGLALMVAYMATHYDRFRRWGLLGGAIAAVLAFYGLVETTGRHYFGPAGQIGSLSELPRWIAQAFGKNQYGLPIFGNLIMLAIPFLFLLALLLYRRRGPLVIALVLFAMLPLDSALRHYGSSEQRGHWFGYWFGHDMFTPPFVGPDGKLSYDAKLREQATKAPNGKLVYPEMTRDAILYGGTDPGRFCPTYMIFCESFTPHNCQPVQDQKFDRRDVYIITQNALADGTYLNYIRAHYNRSTQHDPYFFQELLRPQKERDENYTTNIFARIAGVVLDGPLTRLGARIEARRRREGVYPPKEMYIASPDDSQRCFQEYLADAQRRLALNQLKPGEDVRIIENRVQVSGQVAVMAINALLTKVMFDRNPTNEFFVEESFPLDWMYPYLTPFGIIMKINRQPLQSLSQDILDRDHFFWKQYSKRLTGDFIDYDTPVKDIVAWIQKTYLRHDLNGFTGSRKFVRDDDAQKSFSKLRSSIAGIYAWRLTQSPPEYRPKNDADFQRLYKEADFAAKQAFAFCPYSPEAVYRYIVLLAQPPFNRIDDAILVAETCAKLDPANGQILDLLARLRTYKSPSTEVDQVRNTLAKLEEKLKNNPTDYVASLQLAGVNLELQQTDRAFQLLEDVAGDPRANPEMVKIVAQDYAQLGNWRRLEGVLEKLVKRLPDEPEPWYDLAAIKAYIGKPTESLAALNRALQLNASRLQTNPHASNLLFIVRKDFRFNQMTNMPEFQKLVPPG